MAIGSIFAPSALEPAKQLRDFTLVFKSQFIWLCTCGKDPAGRRTAAPKQVTKCMGGGLPHQYTQSSLRPTLPTRSLPLSGPHAHAPLLRAGALDAVRAPSAGVEDQPLTSQRLQGGS